MADLYDDLESQAAAGSFAAGALSAGRAAIVLAYTALAYLALPALWTHYEHQKGLADLPMVTHTAQGIPGDPINAGLVGDDKDVLCAMQAADWFPADPVTLRSSIEIAGSVLLDRPYRDAPVSPLFYLDRREDLAFEKPDGKSADHRHHVRFWKVLDRARRQRPVWLGAVTYRPQRRRQPLYRRHHPPYRRRISTPSGSCSPPTSRLPAWSTPNTR